MMLYEYISVETFDQDIQTWTLGANNHQLHHGTWAEPPREHLQSPNSKFDMNPHPTMMNGTQKIAYTII